jgi:hypothetical protein
VPSRVPLFSRAIIGAPRRTRAEVLPVGRTISIQLKPSIVNRTDQRQFVRELQKKSGHKVFANRLSIKFREIESTNARLSVTRFIRA